MRSSKPNNPISSSKEVAGEVVAYGKRNNIALSKTGSMLFAISKQIMAFVLLSFGIEYDIESREKRLAQ